MASCKLVPKLRQEKKYGSRAHLDTHLSGNFHTRYSEAYREIVIRQQYASDSLFWCKYCEDADVEDPRPFSYANTLRRHIRESNADKNGQEHDDAKRADGWYDADFEVATSPSTVAWHRTTGRVNLQASGINIVQRRQLLQPQPHADRPGVLHGSMPSQGIPRSKPGIRVVSRDEFASDRSAIPPHRLQSITRGRPETITTVPEHLAGEIVTTRRSSAMMPRSWGSGAPTLPAAFSATVDPNTDDILGDARDKRHDDVQSERATRTKQVIDDAEPHDDGSDAEGVEGDEEMEEDERYDEAEDEEMEEGENYADPEEGDVDTE